MSRADSLTGVDRQLNGLYRKGIRMEKIAVYCQMTEQEAADRLRELGILDTPFHGTGRYENNGLTVIRVDGKWRLEHHVVWEKKNGPLPEGWIVRYINGTKNDNRLENLVASSRSDRTELLRAAMSKRVRDLEKEVNELKAVITGYEEILEIRKSELKGGSNGITISRKK